MTDRAERMVRRLATRLSEGTTSRRRFLARAGGGAAVLGVGMLAGAPTAAAHIRTGCWGTEDVQVCYAPWRVTAGESRLGDAVGIRKGPSFDAPLVGRIPVGKHFGRQSNRIGSPCGSDPGPRSQANGWVWASGKAVVPGGTCGQLEVNQPSGWIPFVEGGTTLAVGDPQWTGSTCGPAADFDCRFPNPGSDPAPRCSCYNGCNSGTAGPVTEAHAYWSISDEFIGGPSESEWYTLRYAADSVLFLWLLPGDVVYRHAYKKIHEPNGPRGPGDYTWSCVGVVCAQYAPEGCGGWIRSDVLTNPRDSAAGCAPRVPLTCPG
ncbi:MAG: hypothetical protein ACJ72N_08005 [Labedaea sp.]